MADADNTKKGLFASQGGALHILLLRGMVASLPPEQQVDVKEAAARIGTVLAELNAKHPESDMGKGKLGVLAFGLAGAEIPE